MDYLAALLALAGAGDSALPRQFVGPAPNMYNTNLGGDEAAFRSWAASNRVPFDVNAPTSDYDMRGFWSALMRGDARATSAVDPNDSRLHFPDYWKTPAHQTFSNQSQWAGPGAPQWTPDDKLVAPSGRILFDDRKQGAPTIADILAVR